MARPTKKGLDYFPLDIDFFEDEKIEAISGEFGLKGEIIVLKLLCAIYKNGYFLQWNELQKMKLLKRLPGVSSELITQVLERLVKWNFFNENLFNSESILTSKGIQIRYLEATKRRKEKGFIEYVLINCNENDTSNRVNVYNNPPLSEINDNISTQSKVKESKVNNVDGVIGKNPPPPIIVNSDTNPHIDLVKSILTQNMWIETFRMNLKIPESKNHVAIRRLLNEFLNHLVLESKTHTKEKEFKSHFTAWCRKLDRTRLEEIFLKKSSPANKTNKQANGSTDYYFLN